MTKSADRQQQILERLIEGDDVPEIAERLGLSYTTVRNYKHDLFVIWGAKTAAHLVAIAFREGLVS